MFDSFARKSLAAPILGFFLLISAFPLELWNEARAVAEERSLQEGAASVISVEPIKVHAQNDGKLVYVSGELTTGEDLHDTDFGVTAKAVKLHRQVSMWQWHEQRRSHRSSRKNRKADYESNDDAESNTDDLKDAEPHTARAGQHAGDYSYVQKWNDRLVDSSLFAQPAGHENPQAFTHADYKQTAEDVKLGAFALTDSIIHQLKFERFHIPGDIQIANVPAAKSHKLSLEDGAIFIGDAPESPKVGDERISYEYVPLSTCSIVAQQRGQSLQPYVASNGNQIELVQKGVLSPRQMFQRAEAVNGALTWTIRIGGFFMMFFGLMSMSQPLTAIAKIVPFVGGLLGAGIRILSAAAAAILSLITISIGWITFRPLLGFSLVAAAAIIAVILRARLKQSSKTLAATAEEV